MDQQLGIVSETVSIVSGDDAARFVIAALEEAGATLLALPASGYTTGMRCGWPDVVRSFWETYGQEAPPMRAPVPSATRIAAMEAALAWLRFIPADRHVLRRIVGLRMLVHPLTERHRHSWRQIARQVGASHEAVRYWHRDAIDLIVAELRRRNFSFSA